MIFGLFSNSGGMQQQIMDLNYQLRSAESRAKAAETLAAERETALKKRVLRCSFCDENEHSVVLLIEGPKVFICDKCTEICHQIVVAKGVFS